MKELFKVNLFSKVKTSIIRKQVTLLFLSTYMFSLIDAQPYYVSVSTATASLANKSLRDYLLSGKIVSGFTNSIDSIQAEIYGKIVSSNLNITTTITNLTIWLPKNIQVNLSPIELLHAFGDLSPNNIVISGSGAANIDPNNIKLPDGNYQICFWARKIDCPYGYPCDLSDPNFVCPSFTVACNSINGAQIITRVNNSINPLIAQAIQSGNINSTIQFNGSLGCDAAVKLFGKIERIAPSPFSIALNPNFYQQPSIILNTGMTQLSSSQMLSAFNNFNENDLVVTGVNLASIKDANNRIKLPDGNYRICFFARYTDPNGGLGDYASNPNLGCGSFNICNKAGGAPQFTQPVNTTNINSEIAVIQPVSPVVFSWLPPQSTCGLPPTGYTYDLEIWELYPNQTVTDAVNNPFVFRKTSLPSTTFLLDINLYKDVLKLAKRYAMRVRAISINPNSPVEIDNDGYSRIEAFQYGASLITQNGVPDPHDYFIPFDERKSSFWNDVYRANQQRKRSDTLVPIKEYIAFALTQNGIAYSLDAIELFLALNPELADVKKVNISYNPNLPVFPLVLANDQKNFDKEHQVNLEPDKSEENKFLKYLDTLNNYNQKIPANAVKMINDLVGHLNSIKTQVSSVDRVTVNFINDVLSELLYELRVSSRNLNTSQYNQLQKLVTTLRELTAESLNGTSFFHISPEKIRASLSSYLAGPNEYISNLSMGDISQIGNEIDSIEDITVAAIAEQLLPFDVIVWRSGTVAPFKPVLDAPDLKATFRVFYALSNLYNHKNPEVNAKASSRLASTIGISLPSNSTFSFWTLNMVNHRMTNAKDIDPRGVLKNSMKNEPRLKKPSIVLKVD